MFSLAVSDSTICTLAEKKYVLLSFFLFIQPIWWLTFQCFITLQMWAVNAERESQSSSTQKCLFE